MYLNMVKEGKQLHEDVFPYKNLYGEELNEFYRIYTSDLNQDEINEYLTYKKLDFLKTIKNCIVFFTVLIVISLVVSFFI